MSDAVLQFLEIVRNTWVSQLYCEQCGANTKHTGHEQGREEVYTCSVCHAQKRYTVR